MTEHWRSERLTDLLRDKARLEDADAAFEAAIHTMQRKRAVNYARLRSVEAQIAQLQKEVQHGHTDS